MTVEELKKEAERLGYYIVKKSDALGKVNACKCGMHQYNVNSYCRDDRWLGEAKCRRCGKTIIIDCPSAETLIEGILAIINPCDRIVLVVPEVSEEYVRTYEFEMPKLESEVRK